jgi:hypothetical protein
MIKNNLCQFYYRIKAIKLDIFYDLIKCKDKIVIPFQSLNHLKTGDTFEYNGVEYRIDYVHYGTLYAINHMCLTEKQTQINIWEL